MTDRHRPLSHTVHATAWALLLVGLTSGCASDSGSTAAGDEISMDKPQVTTTEEGDLVVKRFDLNKDGQADVIKYFERFKSPDNPDVTMERIERKEVDVNADGTIEITRYYDDEGNAKRETVDVNLDGTIDTTNYYDGGKLARKEVHGEDGESIIATRFYLGGELQRVERDRNNDGKVDYWEYYENESLQRIGRDLNGDQKIDRWIDRGPEGTPETDDARPTVGEPDSEPSPEPSSG
jgi:antitoxin component YwqK of YwqJK toxin-antitoxin module